MSRLAVITVITTMIFMSWPRQEVQAAECKASAFDASKLKTDLVNGEAATKAGQLSIERKEDRGQLVKLNGCPIGVEASILGFEKIFRLANEDVVLVMLGSGGSRCPGDWILLSIKPDGKTEPSKTFGTCGDTAQATQVGNQIKVHIPRAGGNPPQNIIYESGNVKCDTCLPPMKTAAVDTIAGIVTIKNKRGELSEVFVGEKPTGIKALPLYFDSDPIQLGSAQILLIEKRSLNSDCEARFAFLVLRQNGKFEVTKDFGNCTPYPDLEQKGESIYVSFPEVNQRPAQNVVFQKGALSVEGEAVKITKREQPRFRSMSEVFSDLAKFEVGSYFRDRDVKEMAQALTRVSHVSRHPMTNGRELVIITHETGDPMEQRLPGCKGGKCAHYFYLKDSGGHYLAGWASGEMKAIDVNKEMPTLAIDTSKVFAPKRGVHCYALGRLAPGHDEMFREWEGPDNPCGVTDTPKRRVERKATPP
ncbi:MAG: hypothetical protein E6H80_08695 [Betaproteobacteria bacterium]|nr:MAG: hypothetical protein E6H80_08695 [Betaproteobacteria bacterium]